jgi:hypothetical protein
VRVLTRFDTHPGVFAHHCHNLEHEDAGMMQNFAVLPPPRLAIRREGANVHVSWSESDADWRLESSPEAEGALWERVGYPPAVMEGRWTVNVTERVGRRFYRLVRH